jgi:putative transposase
MFSQVIAKVRQVLQSSLQFIQQKVRTWTKPNTLTVAVGALADMTRTKPELIAENALLRQQLIVLERV